jgi:hypothetical protein
MTYPLPVEWNSTSAIDLAGLSATISYMQNQPTSGAETLGAPSGVLPGGQGDGLAERAARSRARNWEALDKLADY